MDDKMKITFTIPTYKRVDTILHKTLSLLDRYNVNKNDIILFIGGDSDDFNAYTDILQPLGYTNLVPVKSIGLINSRNFQTEYFAEGRYIVSLDDDLENLYKCEDLNPFPFPPSKTNQVLRPLTSKDFWDMVYFGFGCCKTKNCSLWGIYPVCNPFFMKTKIDYSCDLKFIYGCFWGVINRKLMLQVPCEDKEDYERTLLYYERDGAVIRLNNYTMKQKFMKNKGGLQALKEEEGKRTNETSKKSCDYLLNRFPLFTKERIKKGLQDIRLFHSKKL